MGAVGQILDTQLFLLVLVEGCSLPPPWGPAGIGQGLGFQWRGPGGCRKAGGGKSETEACAERPVLRFGLISLSDGAACQPSAWIRPAGFGGRLLPGR